jgi:predicted dehydrogenase
VFAAANDSATLTVQFANGATGTIFTSAAVEAGYGPQRITLYGENGTLEVVSNMNAWTVRGLQGKETEFQDIPIPEEFMRGSDPEPSFNQIVQTFMVQSIGTRLFIDSIIADQPVTPGFYEGMKVQEVIEAAFESDRSGCWVDVS